MTMMQSHLDCERMNRQQFVEHLTVELRLYGGFPFKECFRGEPYVVYSIWLHFHSDGTASNKTRNSRWSSGASIAANSTEVSCHHLGSSRYLDKTSSMISRLPRVLIRA